MVRPQSALRLERATIVKVTHLLARYDIQDTTQSQENVHPDFARQWHSLRADARHGFRSPEKGVGGERMRMRAEGKIKKIGS